jgi:hypothetical protein
MLDPDKEPDRSDQSLSFSFGKWKAEAAGTKAIEILQHLAIRYRYVVVVSIVAGATSLSWAVVSIVKEVLAVVHH